MKRKVVVWGTKKNALDFSYKLFTEGRDQIIYYIDSKESINEFNGLSVQSPKNINFSCFDYFIWIATGEQAYFSIKKQLLAIGLKEFINFAHTSYDENKKMVLLHGNCHMSIIKKFLISSYHFQQEYYIYPIKAIHNNEEKTIDNDIIRRCSVFIHQDIRKENPYGLYLSDEYLIQRLPKGCENITIPNLYGFGRGFFPQADYNLYNYTCESLRYGFFPHSDKIIDEGIELGYSNDRILDIIESDVIDSSIVREKFTIIMDKMKKRQKNWMINIEDFIWNNYKMVQLFYDFEHPSNAVLKEIAYGVLKILGINDLLEDVDIELDAYENIVYPCVRDALEIGWKKDFIRTKNYALKMAPKMDFREYVDEYVYWRSVNNE